MRARRIIEGAAFGPTVLKVVMQAFDEAWVAMSPNFTPDEYDNARTDLAMAVMNAAREDVDDVGRVRDAGERAMRLKYPSRFGGVPGADQGRKKIK